MNRRIKSSSIEDLKIRKEKRKALDIIRARSYLWI
jgi:hypothetical protein